MSQQSAGNETTLSYLSWNSVSTDEGKEGEIVYIPMLVNSVLLKDKKPGLKEFSKNWFKGKEGKARKKEADADGDGTWMLDMYEAYLAQQAK